MQRWTTSWATWRCVLAAVAAGGAGVCAGAGPATGKAGPSSSAGTQGGVLTTMPVVARPSTPAQAAVARGVAYLLGRQKKDGTWETEPARNGLTHTGGETAFVAWTLLHVGASVDSPAMRADSEVMSRAMAYLVGLEPKTTYVASMQGLALAKVPLSTHEDARLAAERARDYLLKAMRDDGAFTYTVEGKAKGVPDNSNAAAAVQALAALQQAGVESPAAVWLTLDEYWRAKQHRDGGWGYNESARRASGGMTSAGVASVQLTGAFREARTIPAEIATDLAAMNGLTYLGAEYRPESRDYFFLYHLGRAVGGAGLRGVGKRSLSPEMVDAIVRAQRSDGSWLAEFGDPAISGEQSLVSTCYALLAIAGEMQPVALTKLDYGNDAGKGRWDGRPRDAANLSQWMASRLSRPMRWRVVSAGTPAADDGTGPVMLITGSKEFSLSPELLARVKNFVESGGIVLSAADGGEKDGAAFTQSVMKLGPAVAGGKYAFRELPATHPVFGTWAKMSSPMKVMGLGNGVREFWIHVPADLGASWQGRRLGNKDHFALAMNVYSYVTGRGEATEVLLHPTGPAVTTTSAPAGTAASQAAREGTVARVAYAGNADPEPLAWDRFARRSQALFGIHVAVATVPIANLNPARQPMAHLAGAGALTLSDADVAGLKAYVDAGGLLVIEAAGGDADFAKAAAKVLPRLVPEGHLLTIPRNDLLYNGAMPGSTKLPEVEYRAFATQVRPVEVSPRLQGLARGGRWAVVFSEEDLTAGLLGVPTWGIAGYTPASAEALVRNLMIYSQKPTVGPTTGAAAEK